MHPYPQPNGVVSRNVVILNITMVDKIIAPNKDIHILIPRTYKYVTLNGKKNFENVIKNHDLGMFSEIICMGLM